MSLPDSVDGPNQPSANSVPPGELEQPRQVPAAHDSEHARLVGLFQSVQRGANWFYWIAGLSFVNSLISHFGGDVHFVVGLAATTIVDAIATAAAEANPNVATIAKIVALVLDLLVVGVVVLFGWLSNKRITAFYGVGMVLYLLDGLVFLLFQDIKSAGFHAFALFFMWQGFVAVRQLNCVEREFQTVSPA